MTWSVGSAIARSSSRSSHMMTYQSGHVSSHSALSGRQCRCENPGEGWRTVGLAGPLMPSIAGLAWWALASREHGDHARDRRVAFGHCQWAIARRAETCPPHLSRMGQQTGAELVERARFRAAAGDGCGLAGWPGSAAVRRSGYCTKFLPMLRCCLLSVLSSRQGRRRSASWRQHGRYGE